MIVAEKRIGETPLECLERVRVEQIALGHTEYVGAPMTYAGRLDPLASGLLPILVGEECKIKNNYLGLDKEYEVEILFGVATDTGDLMGIIKGKLGVGPVPATPSATNFSLIDLDAYVGKLSQEYPAYSSKTVAGVQLHELARTGDLPDEMPTKEVEIFSIQKLGEYAVTADEIASRAAERIALVHGDFRQGEIVRGWRAFSETQNIRDQAQLFNVMRVRVVCSSGTYMRSLAARIGHAAGVGALAFDIRRTKIDL